MSATLFHVCSMKECVPGREYTLAFLISESSKTDSTIHGSLTGVRGLRTWVPAKGSLSVPLGRGVSLTATGWHWSVALSPTGTELKDGRVEARKASFARLVGPMGPMGHHVCL